MDWFFKFFLNTVCSHVENIGTHTPRWEMISTGVLNMLGEDRHESSIQGLRKGCEYMLK